MLEVVGIHKSYGSKEVLKDISFKVPQGEIFFLLGKNGSGKTSLLNIISTINPMSKGDVFINGINVRQDSSRAKRSLGYIVDDIAGFEFLTGREFLEFVASVFCMKPKDPIVEEYLKVFEMKDALNQLISTYSSGMKKKMMIISCLIHRPSVIIMDEPTNGLDIGAQELLFREIIRLGREKAILIATHDRYMIEEIADKGVRCRIAIIKKGRILTIDTIEGIKSRYGSETIARAFMEAYRDE